MSYQDRIGSFHGNGSMMYDFDPTYHTSVYATNFDAPQFAPLPFDSVHSSRSPEDSEPLTPFDDTYPHPQLNVQIANLRHPSYPSSSSSDSSYPLPLLDLPQIDSFYTHLQPTSLSPAILQSKPPSSFSYNSAPIPLPPAYQHPIQFRETPRKRIMHACDGCRARRHRCSGVEDGAERCERCISRGLMCNFSDTPRREMEGASKKRAVSFKADRPKENWKKGSSTTTTARKAEGPVRTVDGNPTFLLTFTPLLFSDRRPSA